MIDCTGQLAFFLIDLLEAQKKSVHTKVASVGYVVERTIDDHLSTMEVNTL